MYQLQLTKQTELDIQDAFDWYQMQSEFAAAYFVERLEEAIAIISNKPLIFQLVHLTFRQVGLNPFPYVIVYSVDNDTVNIYRVFHTSKNPNKKFKS